MKPVQIVIISLTILVFAIIHLAIYTQSISIKYEIENLKIRLSAIRSSNRALRSIVAKEESLVKIQKIAKDKLKMVKPEKINYIILKEGTSENQ